jgi:hypothetical protein
LASEYLAKSLVLIPSIICVVLLGTTLYLYARLEDANSRLSELQTLLSKYAVKASLLVNFGNGTRRWYNGTMVVRGASLLNLTIEVIGDVDYSTSAYGVFVNAISGVGSKVSKQGYYWLWWRWDPEKSDWELGPSGAESYLVRDGDVLAWFYEDTSSWPNLEKP